MMDERPLRQEKDERLDILERLQIEAADEIVRLRALLDQATQSANSTVRALVAADEREATLRALLREAEPIIGHVSRGKGAAFIDPYPDAAARRWMGKLHNAALGGGAPCATCNGTAWVPAPGNAEFGWLHESRPCPDCDRSALPCDHPEDRRFWNGPTVTCEDCLAMGNVFEGDTLPDRIVQWVTE